MTKWTGSQPTQTNTCSLTHTTNQALSEHWTTVPTKDDGQLKETAYLEWPRNMWLRKQLSLKNAKIERTRMLKCCHTNVVNAHTCTLEKANNLYKQPRRWNAVDPIGVPTVPTRTTGSRNRRNLSDKRQNVFRFHSAVQIPCRTSMNSKTRIKDKHDQAITWPWYSTIVAITAFLLKDF